MKPRSHHIRLAVGWFVAIGAVLGFSAMTFAARELSSSSGSFLFSNSEGSRDRPIRVWYYIPEGVDADARVIFTMHGSGGTSRPGRGTLEAWIPLAEEHDLIVVAPEFSWAFYPSYADYHWGGMHTEDGTPVERSEWAFSTVASLFDEIKHRFGISTPFYTLYGHSAGAQFVHRMHLFQPDPRVDVYVAANPGNYTMPSLTWKYPYGLDRGEAELNRQNEILLKSALQRPLLLLVGDADTTRSLSANNSRPEAMAQGAFRLARAENFFALAEEEAEAMNVPLKWEFRTVSGIAHNNAGMAQGTVRALGW